MRSLLVAASLAIVVVGLLALAVARPRRTEPEAAAGMSVEVGDVRNFPNGTISAVPGHRLFVVNDPASGLLALSSGLEPGCEIVRMSDYGTSANPGQSAFPVPVGTEFINPCSLLEYAIDGTVLRGASSSRGMFRYALKIRGGEVFVDLSLAEPSRRLDGSPDPVGSIGRGGVADQRALAWRGVVEAAAQGGLASKAPVMSVLGALHGATGDVEVAVVFQEYLGAVHVVPSGVASVSSAGRAVLDVNTTTAGHVVVFGPSRGSTMISAELSLPDGRRLRLDLSGAPAAAAPSAGTISLMLERVAARAAEMEIK
jgi:hypothetical protein